MKRFLITFMLGLGLVAPVAAHAAVTDPLMQKLVDKGTLTPAEAEEIESKKAGIPSALDGLSVGMTAFFDYSAGQTGGATRANYNRFTLQRGYINIKKDITPWLKARITPDIKTGSTVTGDYVIRMKYLYTDILPSDLGPLTSNVIRAGLGHTPFIDFEESMTGYRMQSALFQDKRGLITSSDLGVSVLGNIGGKLGKEQTESIGSSSYPGRYGSYHIGVYNGGGYGSTTENNQNKTVQARLTVRPLAEILPGLQLTYFGIVGKGNSAETATGKAQTLRNNTGLISYQHRYFTATGEYVTGRGSVAGDTVSAKKKSGYSVFAKAVIPGYDNVALFGRYDTLDPDKDAQKDRIQTHIAGVSYRLSKGNYIVAAYEKTHDQTRRFDDKKGQVVLQTEF
ncbi:MAG: hypothetical protein HZB85_00255 [Deltaproteobacteria bacterium]|nr:hypothetical protein [Deltaproteobacteria bacterium]